MTKTVFLLACMLVCTLLGATPKDEYQALLKKGDYVALERQLNQWYKAEPRNPEVFIGFFNLHLGLAMKSGIGLNTYLPSKTKEYMTLTDPKTGKVVGYMHAQTIYEEAETAKAISYLDQGLVYGPDRLDMYFGKTHVLMEIHDFDNAVKTLEVAFERSKSNGDNWLWSDNTKIDEGRRFLLENIQDYYQKWFDEKSEASLNAAMALARHQIEVFPDHSWAYSNLASALDWAGVPEDPLPYLQKAVDLDPGDVININNLATYYRVNGKKDLAMKYYSIISRGSDERWANYARQRLEELQKK